MNSSKKIAVVTGASSGIGKAICTRLIENDVEIYSISRNPQSSNSGSDSIHFFHGDLLSLTSLKQWKMYLKSELKQPIDLLIHSAGFGTFKPLESFKSDEIEQSIRLHLTVPVDLTQFFLSDLLKTQGTVLALGSHSGTTISRWGGPYASAKAGLHHFMRGLFEDYRKQGLKVIQLIPDITNTAFYASLDFAPAPDPLCAIDPHEIARLAESAIFSKMGTVVSELHFRPQRLQLTKKQTL